MRQQMQQQKQEFAERQRAAVANRLRAEEDLQAVVQVPTESPSAAASPAVRRELPAAAPVAAAALPKKQRKPWCQPGVVEQGELPDDAAAEVASRHMEQPVGGRQAAAAAAGAELSAQQRRQVWEEMRAAAQRNKQQLELAAQGPGLAALSCGEQQPKQQQQQRQQQQQQLSPEQPQQQAVLEPRTLQHSPMAGQAGEHWLRPPAAASS